ncbi:MAG: signal peptide peptidase SppA [Candidatus Hydrothermarchaeaceae archaeon]
MKKLIILVLLVGLFAVSVLGAYLLTGHDSAGFGEGVAVIPVYGTISASQGTGLLAEQGTTPQNFKDLLERAERDGSIKAVVVEINSPGGSVVASDEIAEAIKEFEKPTVAWISEMGASGGYYVASACDYIVADRASIIGSIGVISIFPEYSRLLEKIGVNMTVIKGGEFKDFSTGFRPMTDEEKAMMGDVVDEIYDQFLTVVADNRNLSKSYVDSVAGGRIYTGKRAKELKLVDEVGGRDKAIDIAARMGGIEGEPKVIVYYKKAGFFEEFVGTAFANFGYGFAKGVVEAGAQMGHTY